MVNLSKQSFSHSAIRKFVGRRPSLEAVEKWVESSWRLSRPCLISLTAQGNFIFRFYSKEDREALVGSSPLLMAGKKLLLRPWSPDQDESSWPSVALVWIRLKEIPFHCWSSDIFLSIAASIGKPLRLDEIIAKQRMFSFARVQVLLNVGSSFPRSLTIELEGEGTVEVDVQYESIPCSNCLSVGHLSTQCPFKMKPGLMKTPAPPSPNSGPADPPSPDSGPVDDGPADVASAPDAGNPMVHGSSQDLEDHPKEQGFQTIQVTLLSTAISPPDSAFLPSTLGQFRTSSLPFSAFLTSGSPSHISQVKGFPSNISPGPLPQTSLSLLSPPTLYSKS
ncbi:hypothetical protein MRB53_017238 [Persea americana]|uniref:Uncharacterized protein n=1 Tax=Persea americana TaxID=3435 RepID=A0ACC2M5F8_PERAE|nr:hypothetical protein MRB53_017238 [Persea americana]